MGQNLALETLIDDTRDLLEQIVELESSNPDLTMAREIADQLFEELSSLSDE